MMHPIYACRLRWLPLSSSVSLARSLISLNQVSSRLSSSLITKAPQEERRLVDVTLPLQSNRLHLPLWRFCITVVSKIVHPNDHMKWPLIYSMNMKHGSNCCGDRQATSCNARTIRPPSTYLLTYREDTKLLLLRSLSQQSRDSQDASAEHGKRTCWTQHHE